MKISDMSKSHLRPLNITACLFRKAHLVMRQLKIAYNSVALISREVTLMSKSLFTFPAVLFIALGGCVQGGKRRLI